MSEATKTYIVPVFWTVSKLVEIDLVVEDGASVQAAGERAETIDIDMVNDIEYCPGSFDVDWDHIVEKQPDKKENNE